MFGRVFQRRAQAINEAGIVVGESQNGLIDPASGAPTTHAVLWNKDGFLDLGTLGGTSSAALGVNNRHQVVGTSQTTIPDPTSGSTESHAFLWQNGVMRDLGTLGGPFALATDVNERGEVGGVSFTAADPITGQRGSHGFIWKDGRMISLTLGGTFGEGTTLNNLGQAVGHSTLQGELEDHVVLWNGEKNIDMGTLGGTFSLRRALRTEAAFQESQPLLTKSFTPLFGRMAKSSTLHTRRATAAAGHGL
jgi:probable HAF family extracellular repeat protein